MRLKPRQWALWVEYTAERCRPVLIREVLSKKHTYIEMVILAENFTVSAYKRPFIP